MTLEGYIRFDYAISMTNDCLGKKYPIKISGIDGFLFTPKMFHGFNKNSDQKLGPLESPNAGEIKYTNRFEWGSVISWPKGDSEVESCSIIFPNIKENEFEAVGEKIVSDLGEWRNLLVNNISVMRQGHYVGKTRIIKDKDYSFDEYALFKKPSGSNNHFIPKQFISNSITILVHDFEGLNRKDLQEILDDTSLAKKPLLPFYFFLDAEKAEYESNYRKCILDSATAVEVCFSMIIARLLPTQNKLHNYIFSKHYSLKQKRELLSALEVKLPFSDKEYINNLDRVRNRVIHGGYTPTETEIQNL